MEVESPAMEVEDSVEAVECERVESRPQSPVAEKEQEEEEEDEEEEPSVATSHTEFATKSPLKWTVIILLFYRKMLINCPKNVLELAVQCHLKLLDVCECVYMYLSDMGYLFIYLFKTTHNF